MPVAGCTGGHTAEMVRLVKSLGKQYTPRTYVVAETDKLSADKVTKLEEDRGAAKVRESLQARGRPAVLAARVTVNPSPPLVHAVHLVATSAAAAVCAGSARARVCVCVRSDKR